MGQVKKTYATTEKKLSQGSPVRRHEQVVYDKERNEATSISLRGRRPSWDGGTRKEKVLQQLRNKATWEEIFVPEKKANE